MQNCDQCEYVYINGVGCHEIGCPNIVKYYECGGCGDELPLGENCDCWEFSDEDLL